MRTFHKRPKSGAREHRSPKRLTLGILTHLVSVLRLLATFVLALSVDNVPSVTVLIAARPGQAELEAADASRALRYPSDKLEIIVARGRQPSAQRNAALKAARGEWIYFLDDDSIPDAENLNRALPRLADSRIKMVGGPNLCPVEAPALEQVFALVLASWLAFGPSRARYAPIGQVRETSEKELILCNLLAHRQTMLDLGGFNEALYPNEENALMDELQKGGAKLLYDPELTVFRRPRASLKAFARMLLTYGRGRAEQFRLHPTPGSVLNFAPPLLLVYLALIVPTVLKWPALAKLALAPLACYLLALLVQVVWLVVAQGKSGKVGGLTRIWRAAAAAPLMVLTHLLYGAGFWRGLLTILKPAAERLPVEVQLERLKGFSGQEAH